MKTQTQRRVLNEIADELTLALDYSYDAFTAMVAAYNLARGVFQARESDPDPNTIALGLQAQALGIRTLATWLGEISTETHVGIGNNARRVLENTTSTMLGLGVVIPDIMTL